MFNKNFFRALIVSLLVITYISLGDGIPTIIDQKAPTTTYIYPTSQVNNIETAARVTLPAVVNIEIKTSRPQYGRFYSPKKRDKDGLYSLGVASGVLYTSDGYIVTNSHVIKMGAIIVVTLNDGRVFEPKVIGNLPLQDIAVLKIDGTNLPYLKFGNSNTVAVGEPILVVGNPYGFSATVTAGIVSNPHRLIKDIPIKIDGVTIKEYIQVDAAVNGGNSGGALVNLQGRLIGIVCASYSKYGGFEGYGFAIPEATVRKNIRTITGQYLVN